MKNNKLQNVKAVKQMIDGTHKFQTKKTTGFSDAESTAKKNAKHEVGDIWEEVDPASGITYVIEQKDGFRIKKSKNFEIFQDIRDDMKSFKNCPKETCTCIAPKSIDMKMKKIHDMCFDCVIDMEHELRKSGQYEQYERDKIQANALAWLASAEADMKLLKETYTQAMQFVSNSDGQVENWTAKMTKEEFEEKIETEFEKFKQKFLENLDNPNKENNAND